MIESPAYEIIKEEGRKEGQETGRLEGKLETARNMLEGGLDLDQVLRFTGLSEKYLRDSGVIKD